MEFWFLCPPSPGKGRFFGFVFDVRHGRELRLSCASCVDKAIGVRLFGITPNLPSPSLGASGALFGVIGYLTMLYPTAQILLLFFIPMQLKAGAALLGCFDAVKQKNSTITPRLV